jgi:hypothetical protein
MLFVICRQRGWRSHQDGITAPDDVLGPGWADLDRAHGARKRWESLRLISSAAGAGCPTLSRSTSDSAIRARPVATGPYR